MDASNQQKNNDSENDSEIQVLGKGTYGDVRVCKKDPTMVVKTICSEKASRLELSDNLLPSLSSKHTNIGRVFAVELSEDQAKIQLTMKRYEGDVFHLLRAKQKTMCDEATLRFESQIGSALDFLHGNGYLHADVKPDNVLYDGEMNFYLTDFSLTMSLKEDRLTEGRAEEIYASPYRPPILFYNDQLRRKTALRLKTMYDFFALFMTLCYVRLAFVIASNESRPYEVVENFWMFKRCKFGMLMKREFKCLRYKSMYVDCFDQCF